MLPCLVESHALCKLYSPYAWGTLREKHGRAQGFSSRSLSSQSLHCQVEGLA